MARTSCLPIVVVLVFLLLAAAASPSSADNSSDCGGGALYFVQTASGGTLSSDIVDGVQVFTITLEDASPRTTVFTDAPTYQVGSALNSDFVKEYFDVLYNTTMPMNAALTYKNVEDDSKPTRVLVLSIFEARAFNNNRGLEYKAVLLTTEAAITAANSTLFANSLGNNGNTTTSDWLLPKLLDGGFERLADAQMFMDGAQPGEVVGQVLEYGLLYSIGLFDPFYLGW